MRKTIITLSSAAIAALLITGCQQPTKTINYKKSTTTKKVATKKSPQELSINVANIAAKKEKAVPSDDKLIEMNNLDQKSKMITLKNTGGKDLKISNISLYDSSKLFALNKGTCKDTKVLKANEKCDMRVDFLGEKKGTFEAKIQIDSNDLRKKKTLVGIKAKGENKFMASLATSSMKKPVLDPIKKLTFNLLDDKKFVTIKNTGYEPLLLDQLKIQGENKRSYSFKSNCNKVLKINEECEVEVNFVPKTTGEQLAYLKIATKGIVQPANKVRLIGATEPFNIEVSNFVVSKNVKLFLDDYLSTDDTLFVRTSFQTQNNEKLESYLQNNIKKYAAMNDLKVISSPSKASKILNIYPVISVVSDPKAVAMKVKVAIHGSYGIKAAKGQIDTNSLTSTHTIQDINVTAIKASKTLTSSQPFEFAVEIDATSFQDEYDIYEKSMQIVTQKLFNVIGLQSKKD